MEVIFGEGCRNKFVLGESTEELKKTEGKGTRKYVQASWDALGTKGHDF